MLTTALINLQGRDPQLSQSPAEDGLFSQFTFITVYVNALCHCFSKALALIRLSQLTLEYTVFPRIHSMTNLFFFPSLRRFLAEALRMRSTCTLINEKQHFCSRDPSHGLIRNSAIGVSQHVYTHQHADTPAHRHFSDGVSSHGP